MKLKKSFLIAGALALSLTSISQSPAKAENFSRSQLQLAQTLPSKAPAQRTPAQKAPAQDLKLTEQQRTQITEIRRKTGEEVQKVLSEDQKKKIQTAIDSGKAPRQAFAEIKLSQDQQSKLQGIIQTSQAKMEAVLTEEQKLQLRQLQQNMVTGDRQNPRGQKRP
jgi:periplasmic protein CpxP/Spy